MMQPKSTREIKDGKLFETREIVLDEDQFVCPQCNTVHTKSIYCLAQNAMGHDMTFTCKCDNYIDLPAEASE